MLELEWPWVFWLLPLPLLVAFFVPRAKREEAALIVPFYQQISQQSAGDSDSAPRQSILNSLLLLCAWLMLLAAAAKPMWVGDPISLPSSGRDLLIAVDISGSMNTADMQVGDRYVDRLRVVKSVVSDFVERRQSDRLGLILFGTHAYLQAPLTFDRHTVNTLLIEALPGFAGKNTAIGDAIGLAVKRLRKRPAEQRVLILLTDGANTAGQVTPLKAAELAAQSKVKIYTIGVGADEMVLPGILGTSFGSKRVNPSADLDEKTLQAIADQTNGRYFRARDPKELQQIYSLLDQLEPVELEQEVFRPTKALYFWPLSLCLALTFCLAVMQLLPNSTGVQLRD